MYHSRPRFDLPRGKDPEREIVTRTFKSIRFEPHPKQRILVIRGEIKISVGGPIYGEVIEENSQEFRKLIRLDGLNGESKIRVLIDEILEQCPFISEDLIPQLGGALERIRDRNYDPSGVTISSTGNEGLPLFPDYFEDEDGTGLSEADMKEVKMDSLDLYVELLYEELEDKVKGARSLSRLANSSENLVTIFNHDTALNAIFRTLREDFRKSLELTGNLLKCILAFAKFTDFHPLLITNKVCSLSLDVIEFELCRYEKWIEELERRKELAMNEESNTPKNKAEWDKIRIKFGELTRKQDQLLGAGFEVVKHLCESGSFAKEVQSRGLIRLMMMTVERTNVKLLTVVLSFLLSMSSYEEAVSEMAEMKIVEQTFRLLDPGIPPVLLLNLIPLYFNLSFNTKLRMKLIRLGILPKLAPFLDESELEGISILLLYNISMDHKMRHKFIPTEIIPKLMGKLLGPTDGSFLIEASSILLNLAASRRCMIVMCGNNRLPRLVKLAIQRQDPLLMKIVRRIANHVGQTQAQFTELIPNIVGGVREKAPPEFVIECLGTLSSLPLPDVDYSDLLQGYEILTVIRTVLSKPLPKIRTHGADERSLLESLLLEVIVFLGMCGSEPSCAHFLIQEGILDNLYQIGRAPALDTDVRLQLLYALYRMGTHTKSRNYMIEQTKIPDLVHSFIRSECEELREVAQAVWTVLGEYNEEWRIKVRSERFLAHNEHWIEIFGRSGELAMDRQAINQFRIRLEGEKHSSKVRKRREEPESPKSEDDSLDEWENSGESEDEEERLGRNSFQSEDQDGTDSDHSRTRSIFDQFKHQFNQEMVSRIYGTGRSEDDEDEESYGFPLRAESRGSRPETGKSRPATAHHSGRAMGSSRGLALRMSSSSFENSEGTEAHPLSKGIKPPIIVNIQPKDSW